MNRLTDDVLEDFGQLGDGKRPPWFADVEPRQRETHAAVAAAERFDRRVPQPVGVGPAVDHQHRMAALTFNVDVDAVDGPDFLDH